MNHDSLLNRLKQKYRRPVTLSGRHYRIARRMLLDTTALMNAGNIRYFLNYGTLLGMVRGGDLIPWDDDLDIALPVTELPEFRKLYFRLRMRGWRVTEDSLMPTDGPAWQKGAPRSIKIRNRNILLFGRGRIVMDVSLLYRRGEFYIAEPWAKSGGYPGNITTGMASSNMAVNRCGCLIGLKNTSLIFTATGRDRSRTTIRSRFVTASMTICSNRKTNRPMFRKKT